MKKLAIINCSTEQRRTYKMIQALMEGFKSVDNTEVSCYNLKKMHILPCKGCFYCWHENPGVCSIKDDFSENIQSIFKSDIIVFATPVWSGNGTYLFKIFIERFFSILNSTVEKVGQYYGHKRLERFVTSEVYLLSNCALPGRHNFNCIIEQIKVMEHIFDLRFKGALLKDCSMEMMFAAKEDLDNFYALIKQAGYEMLASPEKFKDTVEKILEPMMDTEHYVQSINNLFREQRKKFL